MSATAFLDRASAELQCAADLADARANGNPLDPWASMAGTIRLLAAALNPMPAPTTEEGTGLQEHFAAALAALDQLGPADAPQDVPFWRAHVADLSANAHALESRPPTDTRAGL